MTGATRASYPHGRAEGATDRERETSGASAPPTVVGPASAVQGEVSGEGDLVVWGRLSGRVDVRGSVTVEPHAEVEADVAAGGTVRIEADARFQGSVRAPRVVIVDGASFRGTVDTSGEP